MADWLAIFYTPFASHISSDFTKLILLLQCWHCSKVLQQQFIEWDKSNEDNRHKPDSACYALLKVIEYCILITGRENDKSEAAEININNVLRHKKLNKLTASKRLTEIKSSYDDSLEQQRRNDIKQKYSSDFGHFADSDEEEVESQISRGSKRQRRRSSSSSSTTPSNTQPVVQSSRGSKEDERRSSSSSRTTPTNSQPEVQFSRGSKEDERRSSSSTGETMDLSKVVVSRPKLAKSEETKETSGEYQTARKIKLYNLKNGKPTVLNFYTITRARRVGEPYKTVEDIENAIATGTRVVLRYKSNQVNSSYFIKRVGRIDNYLRLFFSDDLTDDRSYLVAVEHIHYFIFHTYHGEAKA